ncbi:MAG: threonine--tRNA ligase [Candidatus Asgardarchaeia archaeon]
MSRTVKIILPNGKEYDCEVGKSIIECIPKNKDFLVAKVNGKKLVDLTAEIKEDFERIEILTFDHDEGRETYWHTASHILAQAVKELWPNYKLAIGPAIEEGFYYDFYTFGNTFTEEDIAKIEEKMYEIIKRKIPLIRKEISKKEAMELFKQRQEDFKVELLQDMEDEIVSVYWQGDFVDLCRGPHLPSTGYVKKVKLLNVASAYWRGDESREVLQRIYGIAFPKASMLEDYLKRLEEIKKRDHRKLGVQLDLFSTHEELGAGLFLWHPKGALARQKVEDYLVDIHLQRGYQLVKTPHIARGKLYETSGHMSFYKENMFLFKIDEELYSIKPMNCPMHILIYKTRTRSYRDLPIRFFELGTVYRNERSGVLRGLFRVRGFTQDDAHVFCTPEQLEDEIVKILDLMEEILSTFGITDFEATLSTRDPEKKEDFMGSDEIWEHAERVLHNALKRKNMKIKVAVGEAAFYGPKIDVLVRDVLGRKWQCSTIQLDFNLPQRFNVTYIDKDNKEKHVVMIHRALLGSIERFFGILLEYTGGHLPLWMAPVQVVIIPISEEHVDYANKVASMMREKDIRVEIDSRRETVQYKIRDHALMKVPYIIVVGDREVNSNKVTVRIRGTNKTITMDNYEFIKLVDEKIRTKSLEL